MKFKVGDTIHVYGFSADDAAQVLKRQIGQICDDGLIRTDAYELVHPKQCRKLIKKERRRISVKFVNDGSSVGIPVVKWTMSDFPKDEMVEFVEVRRKK